MSYSATNRAEIYTRMTAEDPEVREPDREWNNLGNAIIVQAVADYDKAIRTIERCEKKLNGNISETARIQARKQMEEAEWEIDDIVRFFNSEWFKDLTKIDGKWLLWKIATVDPKDRRQKRHRRSA